MKVIALLILLTACASKQEVKVVEASKSLPAKSLDQKRAEIKQMISERSELSTATKERVEKILLSSLDKNEKLKIRESQLIQQIARYTVVKKGNFNELAALKSELEEVYSKKYENFDAAISELKLAIGIKSQNQELLEDRRFDLYWARP